jgi:phosphatidylserine decarboxylase
MGGRALRIGIFLSPFDVHVNRAPCEGTVEHLRYLAGEFLPAYNPKAPERNEAVELGLSTPAGMKILVKQITGVLARRIVCVVRPGAQLARGARYGMIKFGSRTEIYVPLDAGLSPAVKIGDRVRGGETVVLERAERFAAAGHAAEVQEARS